MRRETSFVFHNIDGDGIPTQRGDVVALVEAPQQMRRLVEGMFPNHRLIRKQMNYRMAAFVNTDEVVIERVYSILVHKAHSKPATPRRTWLVIDCKINGVRCRILIGHAINSAWAPLWKPTSYRKRRKVLWWKWFNKGAELVREGHRDDRLVIVLCDGNRSRGSWAFPGTRQRWEHGPDVVFVTDHHPSLPLLLDRHVGPKTGNGRVTHNSLKFDLSLFLPDPR
jgi:hypothetical protein